MENINRDLSVQGQKRVLISFLDYNWVMQQLSETCTHTQVLEFIQIVRVFIKYNLIVDICGNKGLTSDSFLKRNQYDYIFGFGEVYRKAKKLNPNAKTILYLTENPPDISTERESERIRYYKERTGKTIPLMRSGAFFINSDFGIADYLIFMGESNLCNHQNKIRLLPTGLYNCKFDIRKKRYNKSCFFWFGGDAFVHKGLDICIEVFRKHPEWKLYFAGVKNETLKKNKVTIKEKNIINLGFVNVMDDKYIKVVYDACFVILPSCSEGISTAVLTCMRHGLIPVVTKDTGFNEFTDMCFYLDDFRVNYIEARLFEITQQNSLKIEMLSKRVYEYSNQIFTIESYTDRLSNVIEQIIEKN